MANKKVVALQKLLQDFKEDKIPLKLKKLAEEEIKQQALNIGVSGYIIDVFLKDCEDRKKLVKENNLLFKFDENKETPGKNS